MSTALTRKQPELAVGLMPANGQAGEQLAAQKLMASAKDRADVPVIAADVAPLAESVFAREPLSPKTHAIKAMAETDPVARRRIVYAANAINRRDLLLQGMVLEDYLAKNDYEGTLATLDRILRVHPEQARTFFPILLQALMQEEALPAFARLLDGSSDWHRSFVRRAVNDNGARANLARWRLMSDFRDDTTDRLLVSGTAGLQQDDLAYQVFRKVSDRDGVGAAAGPIDWVDDLPPFDWRFADEAGFRAQPGEVEDAIEIFVRGGKGGVIADRRIKPPPGPFAIRIDHRLTPAEQVRDVRLHLRCPRSSTPFFDARFSGGENLFEVGSAPGDCAFISIEIHARSWSGRSPVRGTIDRLELIPG